MRLRIAGAVAVAVSHSLLVDGYAAEPASPLSTVRTGIEQWVQTKQLISRTKSDWDAEKELLGQSKALFDRELASVADHSGRYRRIRRRWIGNGRRRRRT